MDITKLNLTKLKALAYDELIKLEQVQQNLRMLTQEINKKTEESK